MTQNEAITKLISAGMTTEGACGFWGNVMAESGGKSNIAQRGMTKLSDDEYTAAADNGTINFAYDAVGYGLCQWTYYTRKLNLINYAKANGKSVGDMELQVDFAIKELQTDYPKVWKYLTTATNVYLAASKVCIEYESPAKMNIPVRATYGNQAYAAYEPSKEETDTAEEIYWPPRVICQGMTGPDVSVAQALLQARGEDVEITGEFDAKFKNRVMVWQSFNGLAADGIIGAMTWAQLLYRKS